MGCRVSELKSRTYDPTVQCAVPTDPTQQANDSGLRTSGPRHSLKKSSFAQLALSQPQAWLEGFKFSKAARLNALLARKLLHGCSAPSLPPSWAVINTEVRVAAIMGRYFPGPEQHPQEGRDVRAGRNLASLLTLNANLPV